MSVALGNDEPCLALVFIENGSVMDVGISIMTCMASNVRWRAEFEEFCNSIGYEKVSVPMYPCKV